MITVHYETTPHLHKTIQSIHEAGVKACVALNPHTPVELLSDILADLDMVLVMSVNPGFGGQKFIPNTLDKIRRLRSLANVLNPALLIEVDGGVGLQNTPALLHAGADVLVAGNAIFGAESPAEMISSMKHLSSSASNSI
jgi:ribulose-phosphate 3-epimerase